MRECHLFSTISAINHQKTHRKMEGLLRIIRESLQQVANTCKLKSWENKLIFFPLSFPQEKNNNEAQIRRFWTVLARHLCLGSGCSPFPFKIACTSWVPLTCMQLCLSVHIRKPQDRVFSFLIKKCELLEHLWTTSLT